MKTVTYQASFDRHPELTAIGIVEVEDSDTVEDAKRHVYGMCGNWSTASGHSFDAGCPDAVEIVEILA